MLAFNEQIQNIHQVTWWAVLYWAKPTESYLVARIGIIRNNNSSSSLFEFEEDFFWKTENYFMATAHLSRVSAACGLRSWDRLLLKEDKWFGGWMDISLISFLNIPLTKLILHTVIWRSSLTNWFSKPLIQQNIVTIPGSWPGLVTLEEKGEKDIRIILRSSFLLIADEFWWLSCSIFVLLIMELDLRSAKGHIHRGFVKTHRNKTKCPRLFTNE